MFPEKISARLRILQWLFPVFTALLVIAFQLGIAGWVHESWGSSARFWAETAFYGTLGPLLAFLLLHFLSRWLEERETSQLQAQVLARTRERAEISRELNDDALQTLFAASVLLASLKKNLPDIPPETEIVLYETEKALDKAIQQIRGHLQEKPGPEKVTA